MPVTRLAVQPIMMMKDKKDRAGPFIVKWKEASKLAAQQPIHVTVMEETTRPDGGRGTQEQTAFTARVDQVEEAVPHGEKSKAAEWLNRPDAQGECDGDSHLSDTTTCSGDTYVMDEENGGGDTPLPSGGSGAAPHSAVTAWPESNAEEGSTLTGHDTPDSCLLENLNPLLLTPGAGNDSHVIAVTDPLMASTERAPPSPWSPVGPIPQVTNGRFIPSTNVPFLGPTSQQRLVPQVPDSVPSPSSSELPPSSPSPAIFTISGDDKSPLYWDEACVIEMRILQKTELPNGAPHTEGGPPLAERCDSTLSSLSEKLDICRICHCEGEESNKLISPCLCSGSLKFIHLTCLQKWIKSSDKKSCELCNFDYIMTTKTRPFKQWEKLEMTAAERRKIVCSVTFHIIAITCVIWSLYVLIDRSTEEVHSGSLDWPFWTKLIVVAIGFTGGLVFMYVQCKMYIQLCFRWRQFNKLINIDNAPEDPDLRAEAAARIKAKSTEKAGVVNTVALTEVDSF